MLHRLKVKLKFSVMSYYNQHESKPKVHTQLAREVDVPPMSGRLRHQTHYIRDSELTPFFEAFQEKHPARLRAPSPQALTIFIVRRNIEFSITFDNFFKRISMLVSLSSSKISPFVTSSGLITNLLTSSGDFVFYSLFDELKALFYINSGEEKNLQNSQRNQKSLA